MKLILTQEVDGLGSPGDVVEVKDGYGRNYLLPRNVAMRWTRGSERQAEAIKAARAARGLRDHDHAEQVKASLEESPVDLKVNAGQSGRLFGAVTPADIAGALGEVAGESLDKRTVVLGQPIKTLGVHTVDVRLIDDLTARVTLNVIPA